MPIVRNKGARSFAASVPRALTMGAAPCPAEPGPASLGSTPLTHRDYPVPSEWSVAWAIGGPLQGSSFCPLLVALVSTELSSTGWESSRTVRGVLFCGRPEPSRGPPPRAPPPQHGAGQLPPSAVFAWISVCGVLPFG